jgi:poly-gamma-glutamate synthesis protein (capsule biosynthesis protein)
MAAVRDAGTDTRDAALPTSTTRLFLCGDVMTGRGIDQILPHPGNPVLHEPYVQDARDYVDLAEAVHGPIPRPAPCAYIWGLALAEIEREKPDARIVNLETSITRSDDYWEGKGINYRMHPDNVAALTAAHLDVCVLANNHVMDYGYEGLRETLDSLHRAGMKTVGAGRTLAEAEEPAALALEGGRAVTVVGCGLPDSGIPRAWAAAEDRPGLDVVDDLTPASTARLRERIHRMKDANTIVVVSMHWGDNWGYDIPNAQRACAHALVEAGADVVHGHSSHHVRPIETYRSRLILYGCGDFITDYEGISGYEAYRDDLVVMYVPTLDARTGALVGLQMTPLQLKRFSLERASPADAQWLRDTMNRIGKPFQTHVTLDTGGRLVLA